MSVKSSIVALYALAVAAISAALGDLLVESLSNHGVFGPGRFTDGSTIDVAPVTIAGLVLLVAYFGKRVWCWRTAAFALTARSVVRLFPAMLALHVALLWGMETLEQRIVLGQLLGGTVWLGGPVLVSLALHAVLCALVAYLVLAAIRFLEPRAVRFIRALFTLAVRAPESCASTIRFIRPARVERRFLVHVIARRGPPIPSV
jgi:hypothetical protein